MTLALPIGEIVQGEAAEVLRGWPEESVHAVITDPPYGFHCMGKTWDRFPDTPRSNGPRPKGGHFGEINREAGKYDHRRNGEYQEAMRAVFAEALRVLKPGGHALVFGGPRTFHRLACAIEDAGFEMRDCVCWLFGQGFPKSHNLSGAWEGWGTAFKPGWEPILVARKPFRGTVEANMVAHGTGALHVDAGRIPVSKADQDAIAGRASAPSSQGLQPIANRVFSSGYRRAYEVPDGRWPANVAHDGSDEVLAAFAESGERTSGTKSPHHQRHVPRISTEGVYGMNMGSGYPREWPSDSGSAARFFYCGKATRGEREAGLTSDPLSANGEGELPLQPGGMGSNTSGQHITRRDGGAPGPVHNNHPTVKPLALMRWLCRIVTPDLTPGPSPQAERGEGPLPGIVLDPFAGSGSTLCAAALEGFRWIGIEREEGYCRIARARVTHWAARGAREKAFAGAQGDLLTWVEGTP